MFRSAERVTFGRCPKSDQKDSQKPRFLDFLHAVFLANLRLYTTRSQNTVDFVVYDELTFVLHRCRSCVATGELIGLFGIGISGSGVGALRKHDGGMFLASDLGGYAAVASILIYTAKLVLLYSPDLHTL